MSSSELELGPQGCWSPGPVRDLSVDFGFDNREIRLTWSCWFPMESYLWWHRCRRPTLTTGGHHWDYYLLPVRTKTVILEAVRAQPISK